MSEAIEDAFRYDRMVVAASSYDCGVFPCMKAFLHLLQSKTYKKRKVAIIENGSWSPSAGRVMREALEPLKDVVIIDPMITIHSTVKEEDIEQLSILADKLASLNK
jgi:flavorubredoxin